MSKNDFADIVGGLLLGLVAVLAMFI